MIHTYKIYQEEKLILRKMRGNITVNDFKSILEDTPNIPGYNPDYKVIIDYRNAHLISNLQEYRSFLTLLKTKNYHKSTKIFIINSPRVFVACNLFKDILGFKNTFIYSSPTAALHHFGLQDTAAVHFFRI
ncbi:MAG: hypothetical protein JKY08_03890 [Flavobacteriaceae bacterium]|nr:hypothetical protein [Flavobacteriaceae bacterium]